MRRKILILYESTTPATVEAAKEFSEGFAKDIETTLVDIILVGIRIIATECFDAAVIVFVTSSEWN